MLLDRLIEIIYRLRQSLLRRMPAMRARLLFERLPGCLLRILLGRVAREANDSNPSLPLKPLLDLLMHQMRRTVEPHYDLSVRCICSSTISNHLIVASASWKSIENGATSVARPQMHRPVDILGVLVVATASATRRLMAAPAPALADRPLQVDTRLITRQRDQTLS